MGTTNVMQLKSAGEPKVGAFNYRGMHRYLITLPTHHETKRFTAPQVVRNVLDVLRDTALQMRFDVVAYCFLPDRLVLVVRGKEEESDMRAFVTAFRHASTGALSEPGKGLPLWKKMYLERVLRKEENTIVVARDVFRIPAKAGLVPPSGRYQFLGSFTGVSPFPPPPSPSRGENPRPGATSRPSSRSAPPRRRPRA